MKNIKAIKYSEMPVGSWFMLPNDPNKKLHFKASENYAMTRDYKSFLISPSENVFLSA